MLRDTKGRFTKGERLEVRKGKYLSCEECGNTKYIPLHRLKTFHYCSHKCSSKHSQKKRIYTSLKEETKKKISSTLTGRYIGENAPRWKGGRTRHKDGYIYISSPNHPYRDHHGYVFEHRLVMEKEINRHLMPEEHIHHLNGIKDDNRIENLKIVTNSEHLKLHWKESDENNFKNAKETQFKKGQIPWNKI